MRKAASSLGAAKKPAVAKAKAAGFTLDEDGALVFAAVAKPVGARPAQKSAITVAALSLTLHSAIIGGGTSVKQIAEVALRLGLNEDDLAQRCGLPRSTYHRRKQAKATLSVAESDVLARYALLLAQATAAFEDEAAAREWLAQPQVGLGGQIPIDLALSTAGFREVEKLLTRIDEGVYA